MAACGLAFVLVYQLTVRTSYGRLFADASLRGAVLSRSRIGNLVDHALGFVTVVSLLAAVALIALIALVRLRRGLGLAAIGILVASNVSAQLLKSLLLHRPDLGLDESAPATLNSLPSGHSTAAFSVGVALLFVVPAATRSVVAATGGVYACVVALATMAAGWHRAADSVAAFLLVGACAGVAAAAVVVFGATGVDVDAIPAAGRRRPRALVRAATGAMLLGLVLTATLLLAAPVRESTFGLVTAFAAGALFIVGTATWVLVAVLAQIERIVPGAADRSTTAAVDLG